MNMLNIVDEKWKTQYEQLNQRARWYSTQLWVVPFTCLGLIGVGFEKINALKETYFRTTGFFLMAFFSLAIFVHVSSIKYYERKAVNAMKDMEPNPVSSGGSLWYMNYTSFIKALLCFLSFFFTVIAVLNLVEHPYARLSLLILFCGTLFVLYLVIIIKDFRRNKKVKEQIRDTSERQQKEADEPLES